MSKKYIVELPYLRLWLISAVKPLMDKQYQLKNWVSKEHQCLFWSSLHFSLEIIYDEFDLDENPESKIGVIFVNQDEVDAIKPLVKVLDDIWYQIGPKKSDGEYINSPLWDQMIETATVAYEEMMKHPVEIEED